jgi:hypothetical protein
MSLYNKYVVLPRGYARISYQVLGTRYCLFLNKIRKSMNILTVVCCLQNTARRSRNVTDRIKLTHCNIIFCYSVLSKLKFIILSVC